jgi:hypothetical protein
MTAQLIKVAPYFSASPRRAPTLQNTGTATEYRRKTSAVLWTRYWNAYDNTVAQRTQTHARALL